MRGWAISAMWPLPTHRRPRVLRRQGKGGRSFTTLAVLILAVIGHALPNLLPHAAAAGEQASPTLRVETGSHLAPIRALAHDAASGYVVTASDDKTARVWQLATGALLSVFRPSTGAGNDGKLYAAAITRGGALYATGGWSANNDVYLVRSANGELVGRISGLPDVITHLAFSPDGRTLAVGLWGRNGVRLYRTADEWGKSRELRGDADYQGEIHAGAWAPDGKSFAVSSADGFLRSYDLTGEGLQLRQKQPLASGSTPFGVAFSPDGQMLAVGSAEKASVALLDARTLRTARTLLPTVDRPTRSLSVVAWSEDGRKVYAAGTWSSERDGFAALAWPSEGAAEPRVLPLAHNTITALLAAGGGVLYASAEPAWGTVNQDGKSLLRMASNALDFRHLRARFRLAPDAGALVLPEARRDNSGDAFDVRQLSWVRSSKEWAPPRTSGGRTTVDNWFEKQRPTINGQSLSLAANELSISAAVSRDGQRVGMATSHYLRLYDRQAREVWRSHVPATPWQIQLSDNGAWVVAAFSDGTVRWFSQQDGSEQLALFMHADRRRWILWTPSGFFATSPGGEELVGWQVDRGPTEAAAFFPVSRFRADYHRPGLISELVSGKGSALASAEQADQQVGQTTAPAAGDAIRRRLPPSVRVVGPHPATLASNNTINILLAVQTASDAPATRLRARVHGQRIVLPALATLRTHPSEHAGERIYEVPVALPPPVSPGLSAELLLFAENRHGVSSEARVTVGSAPVASAAAATAATSTATPRPEAPADGVDLRPSLYVLAIGVSRYQDPSIQLEFAAKDSTDLSNFFKSQEGGLYRKVAVRLLTDANAKRDDVLDGLEWIRRELTARDVAVVFLAGHGVNDADGTYYFLPQDVNPKSLKRTGVIFTEIRNTLVSLPGKALFFVDTCHSGNVLGTGLRSLRLDTTAVINELASAENGVIVFAAATGRQFAQESSDWGNGAFTKAILEGLRGRADYSKSGRITHKMLDLYVSERVKRLTDGAQSPVTIVPSGIPDFPLVLGQR